MSNDKRFTFKILGLTMEAINFTPKELRKTLWTVAFIIMVFIVLNRLPDMINAITDLLQLIKD